MKHLWLVLFLIVSVPALAAVEVKNGKVTANVQSELLRDVINQIGSQGGVQVSIDNSVANDMVYANFQDLPIGAAIRKLLEGTDINYAVLAGADGSPTAVYISKSETPGAPPKKLDSRPITSAPGRGVVTPVTPQPMPQPVMPQPVAPQPAFQQQNYQNVQQQQQNVPQGGSAGRVAPAMQPKVINKEAADQKPSSQKPDSVPTGGSFSGAPPTPAQPATNQPATAQPNRPPDNNPNKPVIQNNPSNQNNQNNNSDDDDDDDDDM